MSQSDSLQLQLPSSSSRSRSSSGPKSKSRSSSQSRSSSRSSTKSKASSNSGVYYGNSPDYILDDIPEYDEGRLLDYGWEPETDPYNPDEFKRRIALHTAKIQEEYKTDPEMLIMTSPDELKEIHKHTGYKSPVVYSSEKIENIERHSLADQKAYSKHILATTKPRDLQILKEFEGNNEYALLNKETLNKAAVARRSRIAMLYMQIWNTLWQKKLTIATEQPIDIFGKIAVYGNVDEGAEQQARDDAARAFAATARVAEDKALEANPIIAYKEAKAKGATEAQAIKASEKVRKDIEDEIRKIREDAEAEKAKATASASAARKARAETEAAEAARKARMEAGTRGAEESKEDYTNPEVTAALNNPKNRVQQKTKKYQKIVSYETPTVKIVGSFDLAIEKRPIYAYANWSRFQKNVQGKYMFRNVDGKLVDQSTLKSTWARTLRNIASRLIPSFLYDMGKNTWTYEGLITAMNEYDTLVKNLEDAKQIGTDTGTGKKKRSSKKHHKRSTKHPYKHGLKKSKRKYRGG
jgi:hypothetical protein